MTVEELLRACDDAIARRDEYVKKYGNGLGMGHVTLVSPDLRRPLPAKGFPRPTLLCQNSMGTSVWMYDAERLRAAVIKNLK